MKSSLKCDVEISITVDGEETVEHIPECLQGAFMCTSDDVICKCENDVSLPLRYTRFVNNCTDQDKVDIGKKLETETQSDREQDLHTALEWIKQEMMIMKEQDKILMKQFVSLRSQIVQLRSLYVDFTSSNSDVSLDGSCASLDDFVSPFFSPQPLCNGSSLSPDLDLNNSEFRDRTTSLLSPSRKNGAVTRIKWKSDEYI